LLSPPSSLVQQAASGECCCEQKWRWPPNSEAGFHRVDVHSSRIPLSPKIAAITYERSEAVSGSGWSA
jgi:hypothetical protein